MLTRVQRLNIYLLLLAPLIYWGGGCSSPEHAKKKETTALAIHLEANTHSGEKATRISVFRASPIELTVEKEPFINEAFLSEARVISVMDGFAITLQLDRRGTLLFE